MKTLRHKFAVMLLLAVGMLFACAGGILSWGRAFYGQTMVIESKEDALRHASVSMPVRIEWQDVYLGKGVAEDMPTLARLQSQIQTLRTSTPLQEAFLHQDAPRLQGTIIYLNGTRQDFALGKVFHIDGQSYSEEGGNLHALQNTFLETMFTAERLASLLADTKTFYITSNHLEESVPQAKQTQLREILRAAKPFTAEDASLALQIRAARPRFHLRIYFPSTGIYHGTQAERIVNVDVYDNDCLAMEYLGCTHGRWLYHAPGVQEVFAE